MKRILGAREHDGKGTPAGVPATWPRTPIRMAARGLIFAAAEVLYDDSMWLRWLHGQLRRENGGKTFQELKQTWNQVSRDFFAGKSEFRLALEFLFDSLDVSIRLRAELAMAAHSRRTRLAAEARPFVGVATAFRQLADQGYRLAILANSECTGAQFRRHLQMHGLTQCHAIATSCDLGIAKPDARAYLNAAALLGMPLEDLVYVAADEDDISGAQDVGLRTISCSAEDTGHYVQVSSCCEVGKHVSLRSPLANTG